MTYTSNKPLDTEALVAEVRQALDWGGARTSAHNSLDTLESELELLREAIKDRDESDDYRVIRLERFARDFLDAADAADVYPNDRGALERYEQAKEATRAALGEIEAA